MSIRAEYRRKSFMKHRSKKLLGRFNATILQQQGPVNLRATSREISRRFCPRSQTSGHLDVSDDRKLAGTDLCRGTDLAMPLRKRVGVASAAEGELQPAFLKSQNRFRQSHRAVAT